MHADTLDDMSFWDHEYESKVMHKARENAATKGNIRVRKGVRFLDLQ